MKASVRAVVAAGFIFLVLGCASAQESARTLNMYLAGLSQNLEVPSQTFAAQALLSMMANQMALVQPEGAGSAIQRDAAALAAANGTPRQRLANLIAGGSTLARSAEYAAAAQLFSLALDQARAAKDGEGEAAALVNLGVVAAARGDYAASIDYSRRAHERYAGVAVAAPAVSGRSRQSSQAALRATAVETALAVGREMALLNVAAVYTYTGQHALAVQTLEMALAVYPPTPEPSGAGTVLSALAAEMSAVGQPERALDFAARAKRAGESLVDVFNPNIGTVRITLRTGLAAPIARQSPPVTQPHLENLPVQSMQQRLYEADAADAEARGDPLGASAAWRLAAATAARTGNADAQRQTWLQLQRLAAPDPALAIYYGKQAVNELQRQRVRLAALDRDARKAFAKQSRLAYERLADALALAGRAAEAEQALRLLREDATVEGAPGSGRMPYTEAEQALLKADAAKAAVLTVRTTAIDDFKRANPYAAVVVQPDVLAKTRRTNVDVGETLVASLEGMVANGQLSSSNSVSMQVQMTNLRAMLELPPCGAPDGREPGLLARIQRLQNALHIAPEKRYQAAMPRAPQPNAMEQVSCLRQDLAAAEKALAQPDPSLVPALRMPPVFAPNDAATLAAAQRALPVGAVALHYLVGPQALRIVVTSSQARSLYMVPIARATLDSQVQRLRDALGSGGDAVAPARELHRVLMAPLATELERLHANTLVLALDGSLRYLPFAALNDGDRWLVERYAVAQGDGAALPARAAAVAWRAAAFGAGSGKPPKLPPLPAVPSEVRAVHAVLPGVAKLDADFTLQALREALTQRFPVVHIASHFDISEGDADASYLLLGDGTELTLSTLRREFRFDGVELLVLSACSTALDPHDAYQQEFEGLTAMLRAQGAASVLSTLWTVDDESTGSLMRGFYDLHERLHLSRAEALRQAQLSLLGRTGEGAAVSAARGAVLIDATPGAVRRWAHPRFWAPFVLSGDWR